MPPDVADRRRHAAFGHGAGRVKPDDQAIASVILALLAQGGDPGLGSRGEPGNRVSLPMAHLVEVHSIRQIGSGPEPRGGGVALDMMRFCRGQFFCKGLRLIDKGCGRLFLLPCAEHHRPFQAKG